MPAFDLFSIGSWAIYDHLFRLSRYPKNGDTVTLDMPVTDIQKVYYGDCSANVAAASSRLGLATGLGMVVGDDFIRSGYQEHLIALGVDLHGVEIRLGEYSGHNYLYFDKAGDGFCISHQGLATDQSSWKAPVDLIRQSRVVVINEMFSSYTLDAARTARASGAQVVINGMVGSSGLLAVEFISLADILFIAQSELDDLLELLHFNQPEQLIDTGLNLIFATRGRHGCQIYSHEGVEKVPVVRVDRVIDPTGAGDSFAAGTLAGLVKGMKPFQAAQFGATVSSFVIQDWGCQTNLPTWEQVLERYNQHFNFEANFGNESH